MGASTETTTAACDLSHNPCQQQHIILKTEPSLLSPLPSLGLGSDFCIVLLTNLLQTHCSRKYAVDVYTFPEISSAAIIGAEVNTAVPEQFVDMLADIWEEYAEMFRSRPKIGIGSGKADPNSQVALEGKGVRIVGERDIDGEDIDVQEPFRAKVSFAPESSEILRVCRTLA
ncbi:hypothetical protein N658DRAFT_505930 [Parathielavia hyrcaniae]|uniref:Uncharacterized protein n=1 Tax=Parathielavia hyrcaniae TaxID=113614 RepID=A0AAN6T2Q1_9PEZI|nr:hypothetical protein N658DRAFT_505930 [Parathielavia hyrcaniae]